MMRAASKYKVSQALLAPKARGHVLKIIAPLIGVSPDSKRVLDVGCGPDSYLFSLNLDPVGVDLSMEIVAAFRNKRGRTACLASADRLPFKDASFDLVWSCGLLHHLSSEAARNAVVEMERVCDRKGLIVIFDAVRPRSFWARPPAWIIRRNDRGLFVRTEGQAMELLPGSAGLEDRTAHLHFDRTGRPGHGLSQRSMTSLGSN